jgi:hypothetical protein
MRLRVMIFLTWLVVWLTFGVSPHAMSDVIGMPMPTPWPTMELMTPIFLPPIPTSMPTWQPPAPPDCIYQFFPSGCVWHWWFPLVVR